MEHNTLVIRNTDNLPNTCILKEFCIDDVIGT